MGVLKILKVNDKIARIICDDSSNVFINYNDLNIPFGCLSRYVNLSTNLKLLRAVTEEAIRAYIE